MVAAQNYDDPRKGDGESWKKPPSRANAVKNDGKENRERGPEVVDHADFDRLGAPFGKEDRQAERE